jgi:glucose/arabinose dehydrogenase
VLKLKSPIMKYSLTILMGLLAPILLLAQNGTSEDPLSIYNEFCSNCHGMNFEGGNAQSLVDGVWQFGAGRSYMFRNIKYGIQHLGMPSYEATLSDKQINSLVAFLLEEEKKAGASKPPTPDMIETQDYKIKITVVADSLEIPWSIDFIDKNTALITERPGRLRMVKNGRLLPGSVQEIPKVLHAGQGGLLDVAIDPQYEDNGYVYIAYSHELEGSAEGGQRSGAMTRIVRGQIMGNRWINEQLVFEAPAETYRTTRHHYGCRIVFDGDGFLYFSIGDRGRQDEAQDLTLPNGKVHRIRRNGDIPIDNPFVTDPNAMKSIYSYGNRNPQGLAMHPVTDQLWSTEHGPFGGDELNLIEGGINYGWPEITYGRNYNGTIITEETENESMQQPSLYWKPSIAVCGLDFYNGDLFPKWQNKLIVGALKYEEVRLLHIYNDRVIHEQVILKNLGRVRDVQTGPDGAIYVVLNNPDKVIKLTPMD